MTIVEETPWYEVLSLLTSSLSENTPHSKQRLKLWQIRVNEAQNETFIFSAYWIFKTVRNGNRKENYSCPRSGYFRQWQLVWNFKWIQLGRNCKLTSSTTEEVKYPHTTHPFSYDSGSCPYLAYEISITVQLVYNHTYAMHCFFECILFHIQYMTSVSIIYTELNF